jgi:hypothetical protein
MKAKSILFVLTAAVFLLSEVNADAQFLKNLFKKATTEQVSTEQPETTVAPATANGQAAGAALKSLYTQYKADGKLDMANLTNIVNLTTLASNVKGLKGLTDKTAFYKDFAAGLIVGSGNLVTQTNSTSVMNGLTNLVNNVDLSALTDKASDAQAQVSALQSKGTEAAQNLSSIKDSVSGILGLFK